MAATFGELKARAARQFGYDAEDLPELEPDVSAYINEGYLHLMLERYHPWREEVVPLSAILALDEGCAIPTKALNGAPIDVLGARIGGMPTTAVLDEARELILLPRLSICDSDLQNESGESTVMVRYAYRPRELAEDDDIPKLPRWTHAALADWATWRLYMNGNPQKQNRGMVYRAAYDEVFRRLHPYNEALTGFSQFRNLYKEG